MPTLPSNNSRLFSIMLSSSQKEERGKPRLVITLGDPAGIGPEVCLKALINPQVKNRANFVLIGDKVVVEGLKKKLKIKSDFNLLDLGIIKEKIKFGQLNPLYGQASLNYIKKAVELIKTNQAEALVTAPVNKQSINLAGYHFRGHTEYLAKLDKAKFVVMMFTTPHLKVSLVTRHISLNKVSHYLKTEDIYKTIIISTQGFKKYFGLTKPKIAVCSLNPHSGEGGNFGREEEKIILPAILKAKKSIPNLVGPLAADGLFARKDKFDLIVAMYHDQGMIPVKMLDFKKAVNITLGLSYVRTSPAHGTAQNIAGKGIADETSIVEAIKTAINMVQQK